MLSKLVKRHVDLHRAMGFKFHTQQGLLESFANFAEQRGDHFVVIQTAIDWAARAPSPPQRHNRLATVRRFALAMHAEDPRHRVPPGEVFGRQWFKRRTPYIYTRPELSRLLRAAAQLVPQGSVRPIGYLTLLGLLASTGLRVSEALALTLDDITDDGLLVRETKFKKSRLVPIHKTTREALMRYMLVRARYVAGSGALFVSRSGRPLNYNTVEYTFLRLRRAIGLRGKRGSREPRMHDLRHTFVVRSLEGFIGGTRESVAQHMLGVSTYVGHAHVTDTYWYLQATPALMRQIARSGEALHVRTTP
jgi:integrase